MDTKIQIKYIDTKNQFADVVTKGILTRDEWNHLLCLFNISHFNSAECSEVMSKKKKKQKNSGEERVTAKSRPMMNPIARSSERAPAALSSTASERPGKTRNESQTPLSPQVEKYDRTERPVVCPQGGAHQFVIEDDETESELSLGSRSFLHRVNDQVRKRQKQSSKDATKDSDKHSVIWRMFVSSTLQASIFMGKNYSDNWHSIQKYRRSHNETDVRHI